MNLILFVSMFWSLTTYAQSDLSSRITKLEKIVALQHAKLSKKRKIQIVYGDDSYTSTTANQCMIQNIPAGTYRLKVMADFLKG